VRSLKVTQDEYIRSLIAAYRALVRGQFPVDALFAEHLEKPGKLEPYRIVLAFNAESLTPGQEGALREWVRCGGTLVATAETSRYDRFGRKRDHYGLGDVFHAQFVKQYTDERRVPLEAFKTMQTRKLTFSGEFGPGTLMADQTAYDYRGTAHTNGWPTGSARILEAERGERIKGDLQDGRVRFSLPDFVMYSLIVAEFSEGGG